MKNRILFAHKLLKYNIIFYRDNY